MQQSKLILGVVVWLTLIVSGWLGLRAAQRDSPGAARQLMGYLTTSDRTMQVTFPGPQIVGVNDAIYLDTSTSSRDEAAGRLIGRVSRLGPTEEVVIPEGLVGGGEPLSHQKIAYVREATITLFGSAPDSLHRDATLTLHAAPQSTEWVLRTLLTPEKRREIVALIMNSWQRHMPSIAAAFKPVVKESLTTATSVLRDELRVAFAKREDQFQQIGQRYESELLQKKIVPLVEEEIWPAVEKRGGPLAQEVGNEIWRELSLWRFSWRYLYDKSPLPTRNFTEREFDRFVREKAAPILKAHVPELLELQKQLVKDFSQNERIRQSVQDSFRTVVNDQEVQSLLTEIFHDVLIDNQRLQNELRRDWESGQARVALELASRRLDPTINQIGEAMFGNPNTAITPEFARVMRRMVLHKDQRWFVLDAGSSDSALRHADEPLVVELGDGEAVPYAAGD